MNASLLIYSLQSGWLQHNNRRWTLVMKCTVFSDSKITANAIKPTHNVTKPIFFFFFIEEIKTNNITKTNMCTLKTGWTMICLPMVDCTLKFFTKNGSMSVPNVKYMVIVETSIFLRGRRRTHRHSPSWCIATG